MNWFLLQLKVWSFFLRFDGKKINKFGESLRFQNQIKQQNQNEFCTQATADGRRHLCKIVRFFTTFYKYFLKTSRNNTEILPLVKQNILLLDCTFIRVLVLILSTGTDPRFIEMKKPCFGIISSFCRTPQRGRKFGYDQMTSQ